MRGAIVGLALLATACGVEPTASEPSWTQVFGGLSAALLSVTGTSDTDVWAVGADTGGDGGPLVLHFDGSGWSKVSTGVKADLWWVHAFPNGPVFVGGSKGTILRYSNGKFVKEATPSTALTVYGIWGASPDELWAVGGDGESQGFVWRLVGQRWEVPAGLPSNLRSSTMYKVWGQSKNDVWFVGAGTRALHYDGKKFQDTSTALASSERPLFTVHGAEKFVAAVGGFASGFLMERSGSEWIDRSPTGVQTLSGLFLRGDEGYAVGARGTVVRRVNGAWQRDNLGLQLSSDLHSVWISPNGSVWAVGGQVLQTPLVDGVMLFRGLKFPSGTLKE